MSRRTDVERSIRGVLSDQSLAVVATQGEAGLHASLVGFAATEDLRQIVFATARATRKYENLDARPNVVLLVDNRSHSEADFHEATAITVVGEAREVGDHERRELLELYLKAQPHLREFVAAPTCALVVVTVEKYSVVTQFQNVMELIPDR